MIQAVYSSFGTARGNMFSGILWEFGAHVRQMRAERKLSETEMAWRAGVTRAHLEDLEEGRAEVDLTLLAQIAAALGVSMSVLVALL